MAIVDADLHPAATGAAANVVKQHENIEADHILYSGWFCASPILRRADDELMNS